MKQGKIWFIIQIATAVCCVIAALDLRKMKKMEECCNESDSTQDLSSNER